jgi:pimeloyl-ACP methyl ester carboxylesterase
MQIDAQAWGDGPPVVLVHSSASGSRQWHELAAQLCARHRVIAPQLRGYGGTRAWPGVRPQTLDDAAEIVLAACAGLEGPIRLVGHSYGGALALWAARALGARVSHLPLYEPMLPRLLARRHPLWQPEALDGCGHRRRRVRGPRRRQAATAASAAAPTRG